MRSGPGRGKLDGRMSRGEFDKFKQHAADSGMASKRATPAGTALAAVKKTQGEAKGDDDVSHRQSGTENQGNSVGWGAHLGW